MARRAGHAHAAIDTLIIRSVIAAIMPGKGMGPALNR